MSEKRLAVVTGAARGIGRAIGPKRRLSSMERLRRFALKLQGRFIPR